jgi:hypothetical protein
MASISPVLKGFYARNEGKKGQKQKMAGISSVFIWKLA